MEEKAKRVLVLGATGNVGQEVVNALQEDGAANVVAAVRNVEKAKSQLGESLDYITFDFDDPASYDIFQSNDRVFLLRPPHIADVEGVFKPLLEKAWSAGVREVVFLSMQGVERS